MTMIEQLPPTLNFTLRGAKDLESATWRLKRKYIAIPIIKSEDYEINHSIYDRSIIIFDHLFNEWAASGTILSAGKTPDGFRLALRPRACLRHEERFR
jgi:hypothetical protein